MNTYVNSYEFTTPYGEKSFELHQGDILRFDEPVDVLIISAFQWNYSPTRGTLLGSLFDHLQISVRDLARHPFIDLREENGIWVSQKLKHAPFQYIMCADLLPLDNRTRNDPDSRESVRKSIQARIENLFLCLEMLEKISPSLKTAAMPLIGTGNQGLSPSLVLSSIFQSGKESLTRCISFRKIYIIERNSLKIDDISNAMDQVLERKPYQTVNIFQDPQSMEILQTIESLLHDLIHMKGTMRNSKTFSKLFDCIQHRHARYLDIAILSRRSVENILQELNPESANQSLFRQIQDFSRKNIAANWIISYMHIIRILGNEEAHEDTGRETIPKEIILTDQRIMLYCLEQLLRFWIQYESRNKSETRNLSDQEPER